MSDQVEIENELIRHARALDTASVEYMELCREAAVKRDRLELERSKAMVKSTGANADARKAEVTLICAELMTEAHIAEARRDGMKERLRALSDVLNATQSRASFLREEMRFERSVNR